MRLASGQSLAFYEILGPLGVGGMGEVYRARDTRLGRDVAIKVLPEELAEDEERLLRFQREARTLASLNHSNIAGIYGVDQSDHVHFLALELVSGEDLAQRLARGPLPVDEAIEVCRQIAEGIEAAHEAGVVHRDLKPANVRISSDGHVKVLDFGLAKACLPRAHREPQSIASDGATLSREGLLIGTPTYMSPEQVRGKPVDSRADVWAFGCVLFECLTGRPAFGGSDVADILAAVLERPWDEGALPATTPTTVRELLGRCLDKDSRQRLRDIGEARIALTLSPERARAIRPVSRRRRSLLTAASLILVGMALGALGFRQWGEPERPPATISGRHQRLSEFVGMESMPSVSPDGKQVAFVASLDGRSQVWVRPISKGEPVVVSRDDQADHADPRWVDDSTLVYVRCAGSDGPGGTLLESIIPSSTPPRIVAQVEGDADVSHHGRRLATLVTDADGASLVVFDLDGGENRTQIRLPLAAFYSTPRWSPNDRRIAVQATLDLSTTLVQIIDIESGEVTTLETEGGAHGIAWLPDGSGLVYASSKGSTLPYPPIYGLRRVQVDGTRDEPLLPLDAGYVSYVEPDVSTAGRLVATRVHTESDIYRFPIGGSPEQNVRDARQITRQTGRVQVPSASPDDQEVVYLSDSGGHANLWIARVDGAERPRQLTFEQNPDTVIGLPIWSPDGDWIAFYRQKRWDESEQCLIRRNGSELHSLVKGDVAGASWSADGKWLYYFSQQPGRDASTYKIRTEGGDPVLVRTGAAGMLVSDDGLTGFFNPTQERQGEIFRASPIDTGEPELLRADLQARLPLWPHHFALSPDDRFLATPLIDRGTTDLWLVSTVDGALRRVTDFQPRTTLICRQVSWSSDSAFVFAAVTEIDGDIVELDVVLR